MTTRIEEGGSIAIWNNNKWISKDKYFEKELNYFMDPVISGPSNPFPAKDAINIVKKNFPYANIIEMDEEPEFDPDAVY
jgi:hypothetical protein